MIMRTASYENDKLKNRKYEEVHISGDWLYIRNTTFVKSDNPSVIQGENLIYMGKRQYWGAPTGKKTLTDWFNIIKAWKNEDGSYGNPSTDDTPIEYTPEGLK